MSKSHKERWKNMGDEKKINRAKKISESKKGVPRTKETRDKLSSLLKGKTFIERFGEKRAEEIGKKISGNNIGKRYHTKEHREELSRIMIGNTYGKNQSEKTKEKKRIRFLTNNPGKNKSDETKKKMSDSKKGIPSKTKGKVRKKIICPYCNKDGGEGIMRRWHFENCKFK
jgi:hypothetical protein